MRTCIEVAKWIAGAEQEFGDPSVPVCQLFFGWVQRLDLRHDESLACAMADDELVLLLAPDVPLLPVRVDPDGPKIDGEGGLEAFGAELVTPGLWSLKPSLNIPGLIHGFVLLYDVPDPAPWERRIVIAR